MWDWMWEAIHLIIREVIYLAFYSPLHVLASLVVLRLLANIAAEMMDRLGHPNETIRLLGDIWASGGLFAMLVVWAYYGIFIMGSWAGSFGFVVVALGFLSLSAITAILVAKGFGPFGIRKRSTGEVALWLGGNYKDPA